ncbi:MAG: hypothetical protein ACE366_09380 [Bradymonadia bacterium]
MTRHLLSPVLLSLALTSTVVSGGCGDDAEEGLRILDVEGPLGEVEIPGPHRVQVLTNRSLSEPLRGEVMLFFGDPNMLEGAPLVSPLIDAPETSAFITEADVLLDLDMTGQEGWWVVLLYTQDTLHTVYPPCAGEVAQWRQALSETRERPAEAYAELTTHVAERCPSVTFVPPRVEEGPDMGPQGCFVDIVRPLAEQRLTAEDDGAAQAGFQITVQVETDLQADIPVVLSVDDEEVDVSAVSAGEGAFRPVTVAPGIRRLKVTGRPAFGEACEAEISVVVPELP